MKPEGPRAAVVVLAAGEGRRVGAGVNKVLLPLADVPVLAWSLRAVRELEYVDQLVVVVRDGERDVVRTILDEHLPGRHALLVEGGSTRHGSEWNALQLLAPRIDAGEVDVVAIHDSARPLAGTSLFREVIAVAAEHGGALPVREQTALVRRAGSPGAPRLDGLVAVQTPQVFRAAPLLEAYRRAERDGFTGTDTASCVREYTDLAVHAVPCAATNLKVTFPEDVALAERLVRSAGEGGQEAAQEAAGARRR